MTTDISGPLPDLDLAGLSLLIVDTGDVNAVVTGLVIHVREDTPQELLTPAESVILLSKSGAA